MSYQFITYEEKEQVGVLTLNRPDKRNALGLAFEEEIIGCLKAASDAKSAHAIIIRAVGPVFSAGHDTKEVLNADIEDIRQLFQRSVEMMMLMQSMPQPLIAQVHSLATAAGCQLVAACDLAVASEKARFATPGVKIGFFCSTPAVPLVRAVGRKKALEMLFTGQEIDAQEALACGLINRIAPDDRLEEETWGLARDIAQYSLSVLGLGKQTFYQQVNLADQHAYHYAKEMISANAVMGDAIEGLTAFFEKRTPVWKK